MKIVCYAISSSRKFFAKGIRSLSAYRPRPSIDSRKGCSRLSELAFAHNLFNNTQRAGKISLAHSRELFRSSATRLFLILSNDKRRKVTKDGEDSHYTNTQIVFRCVACVSLHVPLFNVYQFSFLVSFAAVGAILESAVEGLARTRGA